MGFAGPEVLASANVMTKDMSVDVAENGQICATGTFVVSDPVCELKQVVKPRAGVAPNSGGGSTAKPADSTPINTIRPGSTQKAPASRAPSQPDNSLDAVRARADDAFAELDEF
jgi:hypothetical protein